MALNNILVSLQKSKFKQFEHFMRNNSRYVMQKSQFLGPLRIRQYWKITNPKRNCHKHKIYVINDVIPFTMINGCTKGTSDMYTMRN